MTGHTTSRGIDIKLFGALFLLVGLIDVLIIEFSLPMSSNCSASRSPVHWPTWSSCIRRPCIF